MRMGVLIKGMKMPESCFQCPFRIKINPDDICCRAMMREFEETWGSIVCRHIDCPLVEVKEPHGDLVERDALLRGEGRYIITFGKEGIDVEEIERAPTVIEAEGNDGSA